MVFKTIKSKIRRFKEIFRTNWREFIDKHPRYDTDYYQAEVQKMLVCGSEAGGFATYQCLYCGEDEHTANFSCKGKACPQCGKRYARDSMIKIANKLLPGVSYRQSVLTMPEQLRIPFYQHEDHQRVFSRFMQAGHACLEELLREIAKCPSAKIAAIVFLHTSGRSGTYNPHLHIILGEGFLLPESEQWKTFKWLPMDRLRLLWQAHLLTMVAEEFPEQAALVQALWDNYPNGFYAYPGNQKKDRIPTKNYQQLIRCLTKYLASPPIGLGRITGYSNNEVTYHYQSHTTKQREFETIDAKIFIGRMVQHILPKGFQRVRYYGLQASATFKKWYATIARLAGDLVDAMISYTQRISYAAFFEEVTGRNPLQCRHCGRGMELVRLYHPARGVFYDLLAPPD